MAFNDLYEIRDNQAMSGQAILNVYHVTKLSPSFTAVNIIQAFFDTIYDAVRDVQPVNLVHGNTDVESLSDPLDFQSGTSSPDTGTVSGVALATSLAATIQFNRLRTDMKNGQKRWIAGSEASVTTNFWGSALLVLLDDLGQALVGNWEEAANPGVPVCRFIILKRYCTTSPSPPCVGGYRLPENDAEALVSYVPTTFSVRDTVRSQVSRKRLV